MRPSSVSNSKYPTLILRVHTSLEPTSNPGSRNPGSKNMSSADLAKTAPEVRGNTAGSPDVSMSGPGETPKAPNANSASKQVGRLPMNLVVRGGSSSGANNNTNSSMRNANNNRYGKTDVLDDRDRQELMYQVQDENAVLKKTNQKLADQVLCKLLLEKIFSNYYGVTVLLCKLFFQFAPLPKGSQNTPKTRSGSWESGSGTSRKRC